jgi:hypothetical protein
MPIRRPPIRAAIALAVAVAIPIVLLAPELLPAIAFPALAYLAWRRYRVSNVGAVLGVVAIELVTGIASVLYRSPCSLSALIPVFLLSIAALAFMLGSVAAFLVRAWRVHERRRHNLLAALAAIVLPLLWFAIGPVLAHNLSVWALHREIARSGLPQYVAEINAVADRLGRAPKNKTELVELLGKPVPRLSRGPVHYTSSGGKDFSLGFGCCLDCYRFDSRTPERGWHLDVE